MSNIIDITATLAAINLHTQGERLQSAQDREEAIREEEAHRLTCEAWHWDAIEASEAEEVSGEEFHEMCIGLRPWSQREWRWDATWDTEDEIARFEDSQEM